MAAKQYSAAENAPKKDDKGDNTPQKAPMVDQPGVAPAEVTPAPKP